MTGVVGDIVDQHADRTQRGGRGLDGRGQGGRIGDITAAEPGAGQLAGQDLPGLGVEVEEADPRPLAVERLDKGRADAGGAAGDEHHFAAQARIDGVALVHQCDSRVTSAVLLPTRKSRSQPWSAWSTVSM